jgi:23S rRNA-/tRNA-specific pseudouridylate synthase
LILVHRLDLETSGVIFVAKNPACATWVTDLFRQRLAKKKYLAICQCISLRKHFSEIAALSEIDKKTGNVRVVKSGGRQAETEFVMLKENEACGASLFECRPKTGRSHQIRVHLDHNGLPILGDKRYGQAKRRLLPTAYLKVTDLATIGHCLHAFELKLAPMPNEPVQTFKALPPPHFAEIVQILFPD